MAFSDRNKFYIAIVISILLHIIIYILLVTFDLLALFFTPQVSASEKPIVLEFEKPVAQAAQPVVPEPPPEQALPERFFELEENPNANEEKPDDTNILAANDSKSAAPSIQDEAREALNPNTEIPEFTENQEETEASEKAEDLGIKLEDHSGSEAFFYNKAFSRDQLTNQTESTQKIEREATSEVQLPAALQDFKGELVGDIALSTYAWKWAPWVLDLKRRFYRYLFVPPAYREGLIDGFTDVYMKIDRDGKRVEFKVLRSDGHASLQESTVHSFNASSPYKALPDDFPDEHLELNIRVIFPNLKEWYYRAQQQQ